MLRLVSGPLFKREMGRGGLPHCNIFTVHSVPNTPDIDSEPALPLLLPWLHCLEDEGQESLGLPVSCLATKSGNLVGQLLRKMPRTRKGLQSGPCLSIPSHPGALWFWVSKTEALEVG